MLLYLQEVEACLNADGDASSQLQQLHARCILQLEDLVELVRGALSDLERRVRCIILFGSLLNLFGALLLVQSVLPSP